MGEKEEIWKKKSRDIFFKDVTFEPKELHDLIKKCVNFSTMNEKTGDVLIERKDLTGKEKAALVAITRFLGNQLDDGVEPVVTVGEVAKYAALDEPVVRARLSGWAEEGTLTRIKAGSFKAKSRASARKFIQDLETKYIVGAK